MQSIKIIGILFYFTLSQICFSQTLIWASFDKFSGSNAHCSAIGENNDGVFILRYKDKNLRKNTYIDYYDHNLRLINTISIAERKKSVEKILLLGQRLFVVYSDYSSFANQLYYTEIEYQKKELGKIEFKPFVALEEPKSKRIDFDIIYDNLKNIAAINFLSETDNREAQMVWKTFNTDFDADKSIVYNFETELRNITILDKRLDEYGNIYVAYKKAIIKNIFSKDDSKIYLLTYNIKSKKWKNKLLNQDEFNINSIIIQEDNTNKIMHVAYFYSFKIINGNYGLGQISINTKSQEILSEHKEKISEEFSRGITGEKSGKESELTSFIIQKLVPTKDSGCLIIAERFFVTNQSETIYQNGLPMTASRNVYNFEEVIVLSRDKNGLSRWNKTLLKRQNSINDGGYFSSAVVIPTPDKIHIIYNEKLLNNGDVVQWSIDRDGNFQQKNLFRYDMAVYMIIPSESRAIGYNRAAIPLYLSGGNRALLKIIY